MTEWIISGNPKRYDVINAFRNLRYNGSVVKTKI